MEWNKYGKINEQVFRFSIQLYDNLILIHLTYKADILPIIKRGRYKIK